MKRIASVLMALLLAIGCAVPAFADVKEYTIPDMDMTVELPDDLYIFEREDVSILSPHPDLEKAGMDDVQGLSQQMQDYGIYLTAVSQDQQLTINISKKESSTTQSVYNLKDLTDEEFESFLGTMEQTEENPELEEYEVARYDGQPERPFFTLRLKASGETLGQLEELCYVTVVNGFSITVDGVAQGEMTDEQAAIVKQIADSVHITQELETPAQEEITPMALLSLLLPVIVILILVLVSVIMRIRRRKAMKERKLLADRLSEYRRQQKKLEEEAAGQGVVLEEPAALFRNSTEYNEEVAHAFCAFHFLRRRIGTMAAYAIFGVVMVAPAVFVGSEWYMLLIFAGAGIFLIVWECLLPGKMFNNVMATFRKSKNKVNEYTFREEDFRVAGIQAASVYPYFQITRAYETSRYFYLYFGEDQAYYLKKDGFTVGDAAQFREFLKRKLGKNFK